MALVTAHKATLGVGPICVALALSRANYYRWQQPKAEVDTPTPPRQVPRALPPEERAHVLAILNDDRFADLPPAEVYATLLNEGKYICSIRTMYRILHEHAEVRERRRQLRHPHYQAPELLATRPNQLWSWDITKLKGPVKWTYFYLYVILDVFSRYVVGWLAAVRESATLAQRLIAQTCARQGIARDQLTIHADHGPAMIAKSVAMLLTDLGVTNTHSRPHVSNDNPFSESQFKTLKYSPEFPTGSARSRIPAASCWISSCGTTRCTITVPWGGSPRMTSTTAWQTPGAPSGRRPSSGRSRRPRSASSAGCPCRPLCPRPCGSTGRERW
jgi:putative transposase